MIKQALILTSDGVNSLWQPGQLKVLFPLSVRTNIQVDGREKRELTVTAVNHYNVRHIPHYHPLIHHTHTSTHTGKQSLPLSGALMTTEQQHLLMTDYITPFHVYTPQTIA